MICPQITFLLMTVQIAMIIQTVIPMLLTVSYLVYMYLGFSFFTKHFWLTLNRFV